MCRFKSSGPLVSVKAGRVFGTHSFGIYELGWAKPLLNLALTTHCGNKLLSLSREEGQGLALTSADGLKIGWEVQI